MNVAYPEFDSSDTDETCSFLLMVLILNHIKAKFLKKKIFNFKNFQIDDSNVCQVRVDFVDTQLLEPSEGSCEKQYLTVKGINNINKKFKWGLIESQLSLFVVL